MVETLLDQADHLYRSGDRGLSSLGARAALSVRAARLLYAAIGTRLRLRGHDPLLGRAVTPASWKLVLLARAILTSLGELPGRLWAGLRPVPLLNEVRFPDDVLPL